MRSDGSRHTLADLYHENTNFNFLQRRWRWALLSGVLIVVSLAGFFLRDGLNLGLDFTGGTSWQLTSTSGKPVSTGDVRDLLEGLSVKEPKIVVLGGNGLRIEASTVSNATESRVTEALAKYAGVNPRVVSVSEVGPSWGNRVSQQALEALGLFFVAVALYLSFRFEAKMAAAAIVAVVHDIAITVGIYAVTGIEVTPATVIAFLTILGFSLYDTVVVFDKIKENTPQLTTVKGMTYTAMANRSLNEVLMRSLNTSFVALLPVTSLLVVGVGFEGAVALREFGLALFIGLIIGAYSSIFVATPILAWWKEREPRYRALADRSASRAGRDLAMAGGGKIARPNDLAALADAAEPPVQPDPAPGRKTPASKPPVPKPPTSKQDNVVIAPRPRQQKARKRK